MHLNKNIFFASILFSFCLSAVIANTEKLAFFLNNRPRIISIFSKPPDPDAPKQTGPNIIGHVSNVLKGGSIGIVVKPMEGIHGFIESAKKIIPGGQTYPQVGHPENQKPPPEEPYDPPHVGDLETDDAWEPEDDDKPAPVGPSWEDIGEDPDDDSSISYEGIIDPRVKPQKRPKRSFINSKIYHVPLLFRSNAKPFKIKSIIMDSKDGFSAKNKYKLQNI